MGKGRPFVVEIGENAEYLKKTLQHARTASQKERLQMLYWLKTGQVHSRHSLAERLGRDKATVTRWLSKYTRGGLDGLLDIGKAPGRIPAVRGEILEALQARLTDSQGFGSYYEVQQWLNETFALSLSYSAVYHLVHYRLKAKLKVPRPKSLQQSAEHLDAFKKNSLSC